MRILHTSDWHIGRSFHGHSTLDALRGVLEHLVEQVREHDVDVVIVAGDVFDSAAPAAACYTLLSDALRGLADTGANVIVTSGNHDSAARLGFQAGLLREGIHVLTDPLRLDDPVVIDDADGPVRFYGIPYLEPGIVRHVWPGAVMRTQADAIDHAMSLVRADLQEHPARSVVISHCFTAGVEPTPGVEREIRQGSLDVVPLSSFDGVDYVALGHIHGRQQLAPTVRYAGAPLHYSFGEGAKPRGSWLIDMDAAGEVAATWLDLPIPRRLVTLRATFDELLEAEDYEVHVDDWVCAQYTDATPQIDAMRRLLARFPFCATVMHTPATPAADASGGYARRVRAVRSDAELVDAFLAHVRDGEGASELEHELIRDIIDQRSLAEATA